MSLGGMLVHARLQSLPLPLPITGLSSRRMRALVLSNLSLPLLRALAKGVFLRYSSKNWRYTKTTPMALCSTRQEED